MMTLLKDVAISPAVLFYVTLVLSAVLAVEAGYILFATNNATKSRINRRMKASDGKKKISQRDILVKLRKERGMREDGSFALPVTWLNQLIVQAGLTTGLKKFTLYYLIYVIFITALITILAKSAIIGMVALPVTAIVVPLFWLKMRRNQKLNLFGKQLPEAIDLITRSLKAGHPVPVAISMVAREMPDPIGTEFGMVVDEVTYGSDLVTALASLYESVGHPDLPLLLSSVSIQSATGGNLREILEGLSLVIRNRLKMKSKIRAISSEGRMSAMFLSALPLVLFAILLFLVPSYYGGIWDETLTYYLFGGLAFWLFLGNLLILKMVSFRF